MCRFIAYLGESPVLIKKIIEDPSNSLISQSKEATQSHHKINADGFGISWYNHAVTETPGLFRSTQPAWNDNNLKHLMHHIASTCFLGHVRASTVGNVNTINCHPFVSNNISFVHNGTIRGFDSIRRQVLKTLSDTVFNTIQGQTDSEHFFGLISDFLLKNEIQEPKLNHYADAFSHAIKIINRLHDSSRHFSLINSVLTDGHQLMATRYSSSSSNPAISLYYTKEIIVNNPERSKSYGSAKGNKRILIASEPLNDCAQNWTEVPENCMLFVDNNYELTLKPIK